jgi:hypothetical protein
MGRKTYRTTLNVDTLFVFPISRFAFGGALPFAACFEMLMGRFAVRIRGLGMGTGSAFAHAKAASRFSPEGGASALRVAGATGATYV